MKHKGFIYLLVWFCSNVTLGLLNKTIFVFTNFKFPVFLSTIHLLVCALFSNVVYYHTKLLTDQDKKIEPSAIKSIRQFIVLFCFNIAFGNISIRIVNLAFSQMLRSTIPVFMLVLSILILKTRVKYYTMLSLIPVVLGVSLIVKGEFQFSSFDMFIILIGILLCASKTVLTNLTLKQYKINPLVLLSYLTPWGSLCMFLIGCLFGEFNRLVKLVREYSTLEDASILIDIGIPLLSGVLAFVLNLFNFLANKNTSPLTMGVGGNIKQVLVVVLSIFIFQTHVTGIGILGMAVAFGGMFAYTMAKFYQRKAFAAEKEKVEETNDEELDDKV